MRRNTISFLRYVLILLVILLITASLLKSLHMVHDIAKLDSHKIPGKFANFIQSAVTTSQSFFDGPPRNVEGVKIDWHDYEMIAREEHRKGLGEHGLAAKLTKEEKALEQKLFMRNGFNALLSDKISLNRSIPDIRHKDCQKKRYLKELPTVSVVFPFFNEHWSTLLRSIYSILNRSPPHLLKEIILVDDCSEKSFLNGPLDRFVAKKLPKVKLLHLQERSGLIKARLAGAAIASADVLLFLDSHIEANVNWLPPLLEPIAEDYRTCVCPFIDVIAFQDFVYKSQDEGGRGAFDWNFLYKRLPRLEKDLQHPADPFESPIMAGGLFAISAKFFWELGGYDEGLDIWGGEQYELSFKIWQCGGKLLDAPCSRVGHIYRGYVPFSNPRKTDYLTRNFKRVAEVWMDEYKEHLYSRYPEKYNQTDAGDLSKQKAIRRELKCKPFKWFIENVAFDLVEKYPPVEPPDFTSGAIQSVANPSLCVDTMGKGKKHAIGLFHCATNLLRPQHSQFFRLSYQRDVREKHDEICWDVHSSQPNAEVMLFTCHGMQGNQLWKYDYKTKLMYFGGSNRCLDSNPVQAKVFVNVCNAHNPNQRWQWASVNKTALDAWETSGSKLL